MSVPADPREICSSGLIENLLSLLTGGKVPFGTLSSLAGLYQATLGHVPPTWPFFCALAPAANAD
jgi:hypothetical protein